MQADEITSDDISECIKAAEEGDTLGQYLCGKMYFHGIGVEQDYHQALYWYEKVAENNPRYEDVTIMVGMIYGSLFVVAGLFSDLMGEVGSVRF